MELPKYHPIYTVDEYLEIERAADERHIYLDGSIYLMVGESGAHGDISTNLVAGLGSQLESKPCRVRTKDTKVRSGDTPMTGHGTKGMFSYPDVVVICGEPEYHDAHQDIVLNPRVIVEVLSPKTESFDRNDKFRRFRKHNPTLTDYILVSQDSPQVEHHSRNAKKRWSMQMYEEMDATFEIASIGCTLKLSKIYHRVVFEDRDG
jgi:Uma2 family endonuclease